ncbi:MAG: Rieske (2Fe-2S) protein [Frankiales bacterium]|nr:Rieske (2Fe-2S) protein [Frankiales bacterium]
MTSLSNKPTGWFQIGWSTDLAPGDVKPLRYFGTDLVAYRDHDGAAHVMDAHCRHLGAHLGHGGCVVDGGLQCPFHGWVWDDQGNNVRIPYQDRPSKVLMRTWPVHEWNGVLSLWHDRDGKPPFFEPHGSLTDIAPHLDGLSFHPAGTGSQSRFTPSRVHPQMVVENAVDPAHFAFVHHTPTIPCVLQEDVTATSWHSKVGFGGRWKDAVDRPEDDLGTLHLSFRGMGMGYNALTDAERVMMVLIAATPVEDDGTTEVFGTYWPQELPTDAQTGAHLERIAQAKEALPEDLTIWEHQLFRAAPALATSEGAGWRKMRDWCEVFYPEGELSPQRLRDLLP